MARSSVRLICQAQPNLYSVVWEINCHLNDFLFALQTKHGVWKGKKMPGHMGNDWKIGKGLKVMFSFNPQLFLHCNL